MKEFINLLDEYIEKRREEQAKKHRPLALHEFYATQCGSCPRALFYSKRGHHKPENTKLNRIFLVGDIFHEFIQNNIFDNDTIPEYKLKIRYKNITIRCRVDGISNTHIIELKTWMGKKEIANIEHILQLNIPLHEFQAKRGKLIYIDKRSFGISEHEFGYNKKYFEFVGDRFQLVYECLKANKLPEKIQDKKKCIKCYHKELCNKDILLTDESMSPICPKCNSFNTEKEKFKSICKECNHRW